MAPAAAAHPIGRIPESAWPIELRDIKQHEHGWFWLAHPFGARWFCSARGGRRILSINDRLSGFQYLNTETEIFGLIDISILFKLDYSLPRQKL